MPVQADSQQLLDTFLTLVKIDSPSGGEAELCQFLKKYFEQYKASYDVTSFEDTAGNLIVEIPGQSGFTFGITGHMDVVPPCIGVNPIVEGTGDNLMIKTDGTTVLGADDKAALAVLMCVVDDVLKQDKARPNLRLLITTDEEVGMNGAKEMPQQYLDGIDFIIAFDTTGPQGVLIHEQPSYYTYTLTVEGKASHAGIAPEAGINAIAILAEMIPKLPQGWIDEQTTANIGTVKGGKALNVVADFAELQGECRTHRPESLDVVFQKMKTDIEALQNKYPLAKINLSIETCFEHYHTPVETPALQVLKETMESIGLNVRLTKNNGASDLNVFCNRGLKGAVLSAGYVAPHTLHEHVYLKDMLKMSELLFSLFERLTHCKLN